MTWFRVTFKHALVVFKASKWTPYNQSRFYMVSPVRYANTLFKLSDIGEGIQEVVIKEWYVKEGDIVKQFDKICEVQSDKASVTISSRYDGLISKLCHKIDDMVPIGDTLIEIETAETTPSPEESTKTEKPKEPKKDTVVASSTVLATPAVRRIARENQINLSAIPASGKDGRVLKNDIETYLGQNIIGISEDRIEPIKGYSKAMVKTMTESLKIPHFVYSDEVKLTNLVQLRDEIKEEAVAKGYKITYMPFFIKAASKALTQIPVINSSLDGNCERVIYKKNHNIGVAIATNNGLVVPNIKGVQNKSILEIAKELMRLQESGRKGSFKPDDLVGGTFTISNIGTVGGTYTKPVILPPEVSIVAIGATQVLPRFNESREVIPEFICNVSWAADHRIIDGVTMANFSNIWKHYIENPKFLLLDL